MAGLRKNREILSGGKRYAQKQVKKHRVEEVVFDKESRVEYLTGFHKRKLQRQKKAQEYNKEQERLARIEERKQMRDERKQDMENQLLQFNKTMGDIAAINEDAVADEDWSGFTKEKKTKSDSDNSDDDSDDEEQESAATPGILNHKEVYTVDKDTELLPASNAIIDDETTVTVESLDNPAVLSAQEATLEAIARANNVNLAKSAELLDDSIQKAKNYAVMDKTKPEKQKKKKFRYLTKAERRDNVRKQKTNSKSSRGKRDAKDSRDSKKDSKSSRKDSKKR